MKMPNEEAMAGVAGADVPGNYDSRKLKKDVQAVVTRLSTDGMPMDDESTWDSAGHEVALRFGLTIGALSWLAHKVTFRKDRGLNFRRYWEQALEEQSHPVLPGMEQAVKVPQVVLLDDEEVVIGDPRLTLAVLIEQASLAALSCRQEAGAMELRAKELMEQHTSFAAMAAAYEKVARENPYGLTAEEIVYDKKQGVFVPARGAYSHSSRGA
jgi:hypothetical protein